MAKYPAINLFGHKQGCFLAIIQFKQAFDSIFAGNTVVPYRSLKKFLNYHKLLFIDIYNSFNFQIENYNYDVQNGHVAFQS